MRGKRNEDEESENREVGLHKALERVTAPLSDPYFNQNR
jgi:hypothetical protein